jgi:NTE family protein
VETGPSRHLSHKGIASVLDQVLRIMLYGRMHYGLERYELEHPEIDILLLEPRREDLEMSGYNIMRYGARRVVARDGYRSVVREVRRHRTRYARLLARHGITLRDPRGLPDLPDDGFRAPVAVSLGQSLDRLSAKRG